MKDSVQLNDIVERFARRALLPLPSALASDGVVDIAATIRWRGVLATSFVGVTNVLVGGAYSCPFHRVLCAAFGCGQAVVKRQHAGHYKKSRERAH
jgi:hypothetical protein